VVFDLCQRLLEHDAPGLHFYSMNQSGPALRLWRDLGLPGADSIGADA
jgi:methylenetetrahydrofolate reductase (NADPH)